MNEAVFRIGMVLMVFAMLAGIATTPALAHVDVYFSPEVSTLDLAVGENVSVQILADVDANETNGYRVFQVGVDFNPDVISITAEEPCKLWYGPYCVEPWYDDFWAAGIEVSDDAPYGNQFLWMTGANLTGWDAPKVVPIANLTLERVGTGKILLDISPLEFTHEIRLEPTKGSSRLFDKYGYRIKDENITWYDRSERMLYAHSPAWNLISLPFVPENNSVESVLASVWDNVSGPVYKYNATTKQFESVTTMEPGVGYFVDITSNCSWVYSGTEKYDEMNVWLEPGLNMIGALCWPKNVSDVLTAEKHWYATTFDARMQKYTDTFNPVAPDVFNRLTKMEPGAGYFISAKQGCWLNVSC